MTILAWSQIILVFLLFLNPVDRGTCDCEECACNLAPLSELSYFGVGNTAADFNAVENNCECDPDDCYNPNFPGVCACSNI